MANTSLKAVPSASNKQKAGQPLPDDARLYDMQTEREVITSFMAEQDHDAILNCPLRPHDFSYLTGNGEMWAALRAIARQKKVIRPETISEYIGEKRIAELGGLKEFLVDPAIRISREHRVDHLRSLSMIRQVAEAWSDGAADVLNRKLEFDLVRNRVSDCVHKLEIEYGRSKAIVERCVADITPQRIDWLWYPRIARRMMTLIGGNPGEGKSLVTGALATAVSLGAGLPHWPADDRRTGNVVMFTTEDNAEEVIRPRLEKMGADLSKVFIVDYAVTFDDQGFAAIRETLVRRTPVLVTIDPLFSYFGTGVDMHRQNETRALLDRVNQLAFEFDLAIAYVMHLNKTVSLSALKRIIGSVDFVARPRSALLIGRDERTPERRAVVHFKSNNSALAPTLQFDVLRDPNDERGAPLFIWQGESDLTEIDLLADPVSKRKGQTAAQAAAFLESMLADGEVPSDQIFTKGAERGLSPIALRRAKRDIGVQAHKRGGKFGGGKQEWLWSLPADNEGDDD